MSAWSATGLRLALWLTLGGWIGAWGLFGLVVAPTAFRALPSAEVAGQLVGPVLTALHLYGAGAGLALALLAAVLGRSRWLALLPLLLGAVCLVSQFGVTAAIAQVRPGDFNPNTPADAAAHFAELHQLSLALYLLVGAGIIVLAALHARVDALGQHPGPTGGKKESTHLS